MRAPITTFAVVDIAAELRAGQRWGHFAACADSDPELFTAPDRETQQERESRELWAKSVCGGCPVQTQCLKDALDSGDRWSVRGGLTPDERMNRTDEAGSARPAAA